MIDINNVFSMGHEDIVFHHDKKTGLKAIVGIHDTTLGPSLGGVRIWDYKNEYDAINDVLRLSQGMTLKAAFAGFNLGGGKAVIIGDASKIKTKELLLSFGRFVQNLQGKYITAPDVNSTIEDMVAIKETTDHVIGLPKSMGGGDDPSEFTAYGVYLSIKAACKYRFGSDSLKGKKIIVEGVGKLGNHLLRFLSKENPKIYICDISKSAIEKALRICDAEVVDIKDIFDIDVDIYSPNALGAILNDATIKRHNCEIIVGGANNQLEQPLKHAKDLEKRGILYLPDFVVNAGGLINVYNEYNKTYNRQASFTDVEKIYDRCLDLLKKHSKSDLDIEMLAQNIGQERILAVQKLNLTDTCLN